MLLAMAAVTLSCGGDSVGPGGSGDVATVTVSPANDTTTIGGTVALQVTVRDAGGNTLNGRKVVWNSEHPEIATVSDGLVTGVAAGTTRIAASVEGQNGTAMVTVLPQRVVSVSIAPPTVSIRVGDKAQLHAAALDANGDTLSGRPISWASNDTTVATVDDNGVVTGIATGNTTITATSDGRRATAPVSVGSQPVASIAVSPSKVNITAGQTSQLTATVRDSAGTLLSGRTVAWNSSNDNIARVSTSGLVTGVAAGSATITATSETKSTTVPVTVAEAPANAVVISPKSATVFVDSTTQLSAVVTDANGNPLSGRPISWSSGTKSVATVSPSGVVTGVAPGSATITATSEGKSGTATIAVKLVPVASVTVTPSSTSLQVGKTVQLAAKLEDANGKVLTGRTVTWSSGDNSVATVSTSGLVTAVAPGATVIQAESEGQRGFASISVGAVPVASVTVSPSSKTIVVGDTTRFTATPKDADGNALTGRTISWFSDNTTVATVNSSTGLVTAKATGTATISATVEGKQGSATLTVQNAPVNSVTVSPSADTILIGQTASFTATLKDAKGNTLTGRTITWKSTNTAIATVTSAGVATGKAAGTAGIIATSEGKADTATITVKPVPVASVSVAPSETTIVVGDTLKLVATAKDSAGGALTGRTFAWTEDPTNLTSLTSSGGTATLVAHDTGTVTVTATSEGKSGTATVHVHPAPVATVTVTPSADTLLIGNTAQLTATLKDKRGNTLTGRTITWSSGNTGVATVDPTTGEVTTVTAVSAGTTTITAMSEGQTGTAAITAQEAPVQSITVTPTDTTILVGQTAQFTDTVKDAEGNVLTDRAVTWSSSDAGVATIDDNGKATAALSLGGTTTISATSGTVTGSATLTVSLVPVGLVVIAPADTTLIIGDAAAQFTATPEDSAGHPLSGRTIAWSSNPDSVASVDPSGLVTAKLVGTAIIMATSEGKNGTANVNVTATEGSARRALTTPLTTPQGAARTQARQVGAG
ncbi:MAG TPA: Ig-like domain-containing protein [Gemmatimonadaceae bacterium]|nr:Ig-like domain-containing protein [Gemmatimonadaceae bacterium]